MSEQLSRRSGAFAASPPTPKRAWEGTKPHKDLTEMREIALLFKSKKVGSECDDLIAIIDKMLTSGGKSQDALDVTKRELSEDAIDLASYLARRVGAKRILEDKALYDFAANLFSELALVEVAPVPTAAAPEKKKRGNAAAFDMETPPARWQEALL